MSILAVETMKPSICISLSLLFSLSVERGHLHIEKNYYVYIKYKLFSSIIAVSKIYGMYSVVVNNKSYIKFQLCQPVENKQYLVHLLQMRQIS